MAIGQTELRGEIGFARAQQVTDRRIRGDALAEHVGDGALESGGEKQRRFRK